MVAALFENVPVFLEPVALVLGVIRHHNFDGDGEFALAPPTLWADEINRVLVTSALGHVKTHRILLYQETDSVHEKSVQKTIKYTGIFLGINYIYKMFQISTMLPQLTS